MYIYSTRIDFFTNRTLSVPYRTMLYRYGKKKFVSLKNIRFARSAVREKVRFVKYCIKTSFDWLTELNFFRFFSMARS